MQELNRFIECMKKEADLLIRFAGLEEEMQRLVGERRWEGLESAILRLRKKSELVNRAEEERVESFHKVKAVLSLPDESGFLKILPFIPEETRREISAVYRKLKMAVYAVKGATLRLSYFFQSYADTVKKVMGEIFPHRKGKLYSRDGQPAKTIDYRLVLDRRL